MEKEIWKSVVGFENLYEISNLGNVKTLIKKGYYQEKIKKQGIDIFTGYKTVQLYKSSKPFTIRIHSLVVQAFLNFKTNRQFVCNHIDGDKTNNKLENLEIVTQKENVNKNLLLKPINYSRSDFHYKTKLKKEDLIKINQMFIEKKSSKEISELFNVKRGTISRIRNGSKRSFDITIKDENKFNFFSKEQLDLAIELIKQHKKPYYIEQKTKIGRKTKKMKELMMIYAEQYGNILN
jgi:hypothetical protein